MSGLQDFETGPIAADVGALHSIGFPAIESWMVDRAQFLGFGELVVSQDDLGRIGPKLFHGLAVIGDGPRAGHSEVAGVAEMWEKIAQAEAHPLIAAQAARNLWEAKKGSRPFDSAQTAIRLFTSVAQGSAGRACERAEAAVDALEVAAEVGSEESVRRQLGSVVGLLDQALDNAEPLATERVDARTVPKRVLTEYEYAAQATSVKDETEHHGACLYLLRAIAALQSGRYAYLVDRGHAVAVAGRLAELVKCRDTFSSQVLEVRLNLAGGDQPERALIVEQQIGWTRDLVADDDAFRKYVILMDCESLARDTGLTGLAEKLRVDLQSLHGSIEFERVRTTAPIPEEILITARATVEKVCEGDSLTERLRRLAQDGVSGWRNAGERAVPAASSVASMFPAVTIGHHGAPSRRSGPGESDKEGRRTTFHVGQLKADAALVLVPALERVLSAAGAELTDAIAAMGASTGLLDVERSKCIADAMGDWQASRHDAALHALVPRVEYLIRRRAELKGIPIILPTDGTSRGGHISLGPVLDKLEESNDSHLVSHLRSVLVDDNGLNLRNDVAHGGIVRGDEQTAAIAIHALLLCLFEP